MDKFNNKKLNERHAHDPKLGDYWHEMFVGICVVIEVGLIHVTIFDILPGLKTWDS